MGKYFNGKRFDYIKTGTTDLSRDAIKRFSKTGGKTKNKNKHKLGNSVKTSIKNLLDRSNSSKRSHSFTPNMVMDRLRKITNRNSNTTKVMKKRTNKKKVSKWQSLVNGVKARSTRSFTALRNLAKKLYEFVDEI